MNYYKVKDAMQDSECPAHIPEEYHYIFKQTVCPTCGHELEISDTRCIVRCPNYKCPARLAAAYAKIYKALGVKGFAINNLSAYLRDNNQALARAAKVNMDNFRQKLKDPSFTYTKVVPKISLAARFNPGREAHNLDRRIGILQYPPAQIEEEVRAALSEPRVYAEAVAVMQLPMLGSRSKQVFKGCDSFNEFIELAKQNGSVRNYLLNKVFSKKSEVLVDQIITTLKEFQRDLEDIPSVFNIVTSKIAELPMVITGNISTVTDENGNRVTKRDFVRMLNAIAEPLNRRFDLCDSTTEKTMILVSDSGASSHNFVRALEINAKREGTDLPQIMVTDAASLLATLQELAEESTNEGADESTVLADGDSTDNVNEIETTTVFN